MKSVDRQKETRSKRSSFGKDTSSAYAETEDKGSAKKRLRSSPAHIAEPHIAAFFVRTSLEYS